MRKRHAMSAAKIAVVSIGWILAGTVNAQLLPAMQPRRPVATARPVGTRMNPQMQLQQYLQTGIPTPGTIVTEGPPRVVSVGQPMGGMGQAAPASFIDSANPGMAYPGMTAQGGYPVQQVAGQIPVGRRPYEQPLTAMESKAANDAQVASLVAAAGRYESAGQPAAAVESYHRALELDATDFHTLMSFARLKHRIGDLDGAIFTYQSVLKLHPNNAMAQNDLALCQVRKGELQNAAELLEAAVANKPSSKRYRNNLATVLVQMGDTKGAIGAITPTSGEAIARLFVAHLLKGKNQPEEATKQLTEALRLDPSLIAARQLLAELEMPVRMAAEQMMHIPGKVVIPAQTATAPRTGNIRLQSAEAPITQPATTQSTAGTVQRIGETDEAKAIDDSMSAVFRADHYEIIESLEQKSPEDSTNNSPNEPAILKLK